MKKKERLIDKLIKKITEIIAEYYIARDITKSSTIMTDQDGGDRISV